VVSFGLALQQKQDLVIEALLLGIERFGKPKEVLTDQGRQYFSWRGKSVFQKLLSKHGIQHVVARSHHPQTVGKCERLWKTVQEEFLSRVQPKDIEETRERLFHFFAHYNHARPHQGIGGLYPADRFFGAESEVRSALEAQQAENELKLALDEAPRKSVYLTGRIGDRSVSLHGERGKLVLFTGEDVSEPVLMDQMGMQDKEASDERGDGGSGESKEPEAAAVVAACAEAGGGAGAGLVGSGERGGAGLCAQGGGGDPASLAGPGEPQRGGDGTLDAPLAGVAALEAGGVGAAGGGLKATQGEGEARGGGAAAGEPLEIAAGDREAETGSGDLTEPGGSLEGVSGAPDAPEGPGGVPCRSRTDVHGSQEKSDGSWPLAFPKEERESQDAES
jgi:hypothetical protein